jgi:hypothetical protein
MEVALGTLRLNLCIRGRCGAEQHEQERRVEMAESS